MPCYPAQACRLPGPQTPGAFSLHRQSQSTQAISRHNALLPGPRAAGFLDDACCEHRRIEIRKIWITTQLNGYLNFPHVAQAFVIERQCTDKKSGEHSHETAYGITSQSPQQADPQSLLATNRGHWRMRTAATISSTGTMTKTTGSARVMARRTSRDSGALRLA